MNAFYEIAQGLFRHERRQRAFRKKLGVFNYKIGKIGYHKKPGLIDLKQKERMIEKGHQAWIYRKEQKSDKFFGEFGKKGFILDRNKIPNMNVPDLQGFDLKPYTSALTPRIEIEIRQQIKNLNDFTISENFDRSSQKVITVDTPIPVPQVQFKKPRVKK